MADLKNADISLRNLLPSPRTILLLAAGAAIIAALLYAIIAVFFPNTKDGIERVAKRSYVSLEDRYYDLFTSANEYSVEDPAARSVLPEFKIIPALAANRRTPHVEQPRQKDGLWLRSSGDNAATRYSTLDQITPANVSQLHIAWTYRDPKTLNIQATPVFDGERLIFPTPSNTIKAIDPATGSDLWEFNPKAKFPAKRGLIVDLATNTIFFPAGSDLRAISSLDGTTKKSFNGGKVRLAGESSVAPAICDGMVISTSSGEMPVIEAFAIASGKRIWTTDLLPADLPRGIGGRPSRQAGGNPWGGFSVDLARCIAFVSTGNPAPVLVGTDRPGNNPGSVSVNAIDLRTGKIIWRFQEIAHDLWDLDIPAPPILTTVSIDGQISDVVATPTKAGNTLLLDRLTGQPIFDWRLRKAPTSKVPGERTSPYQPDPILPQPFARQIFSLEEVTTIGEKNRSSIMQQLNGAAFGFFEPPNPSAPLVFYGLHGGAEWPGGTVNPADNSLFIASNNVPSILGLVAERTVTLDANHPGRKIYQENCAVCHGDDLKGRIGPNIEDAGYRLSNEAIKSIITNGQQAMPAITINEADVDAILEYLGSGAVTGSKFPRFRRDEYRRLYDSEGYPGSKPPWGTISKLDLNSGQIVWQVPFGRDRKLEDKGIMGTGTENFGGLMTTASALIFATGTKDKMVHAFDSRTGSLLWSSALPFNGSAPPMTYSYRGQQYVVVPATGGGTLQTYDNRVETGGSFVAFKLRNIQI